MDMMMVVAVVAIGIAVIAAAGWLTSKFGKNKSTD